MIRNTAGAFLLAATLGALALTPVTDVHAGTVFDGPWSVIVYTSKGPCDPSYRFSGQITNGQISYAYGSLVVTGQVDQSGLTYVHVTAASAHGEARGRMTASHGSGTWSGEGPDGRCAGTWVAMRPG